MYVLLDEPKKIDSSQVSKNTHILPGVGAG